MSYTPKNVQIFTAAFAGALAGMGLSDRIISNSDPVSYAGLASVAGAFAQAIDTAWTDTRATTLLDIEAIQSNCAAYWQDRSPIVDATSTNAATHAASAVTILATITASESYYAAQGITPPAIPGGTSGGFPNVANLTALGAINWATNGLAEGYQYYVQTQRSFWILAQTSTETVNGNTVIAATGGGRWLRNKSFAHPSWLVVNDWYIDATNGNDENDGQASVSGANNVGPLKTYAELAMRWNGGIISPTHAVSSIKLCTVNILTSLPTTDPVYTSCVVLNLNVNLWFKAGPATQLYAGTFSAVTALSPSTNQALDLTDAGIGNWTTYLNKRWRITAGARQNAMGWVAKDLGAQKCRSSNAEIPGNMNPANAAFYPIVVGGSVVTPQVGDTFVIEDLITISVGPITVKYIEAATTSFSAGVIVFGEFAFRANNIGITLNGDTSLSTISFHCYSCIIPRLSVQASCYSYFDNCLYSDFISLIGGMTQFSCGLVIAGTNGIGLESTAAGVVAIENDTMFQGVGIRGANITVIAACAFDSANTVANAGGHGFTVSKYRTTIPKINNVSWMYITVRIWGSGNAGKGLYIGAGCNVVYANGIGAALKVTGTGGDWSLNNGTTANVWDQTASAGAGAYLAPRNSTWANLIATVAGAGFGGNAVDVATGTRISQAAA